MTSRSRRVPWALIGTLVLAALGCGKVVANQDASPPDADASTSCVVDRSKIDSCVLR